MTYLEIINNFIKISGANGNPDANDYVPRNSGRFECINNEFALFTGDFQSRNRIGTFENVSRIIRDSGGSPIITVFSSKEELELYLMKNTGVVSNVLPGDVPLPVILGNNDLVYDAWGRQKVINDFSMFAALWTFNVPNSIWLMYLFNKAAPSLGFVEQTTIAKDNTDARVASKNGYLVVKADSTHYVHLQSKRHIRYQPNRGFLYSSAVILPNPNSLGKRHFGMPAHESGVFFELEGLGSSWKIHACKRTTLEGVTTEIKEDVTALLPDGFDPSKGNVYDIQMQWRGVGDFYFFVNLQKVYTFNFLGTLTAMSISNPALHVGFSVMDTEEPILCGCVDITSEGGHISNKHYTSATTGETLIRCRSTSGTGIFAIKVPDKINYNSDLIDYTRDLILSRLTSFARDESMVSMYIGRLVNTPNLEGLSLWEENPDSFWQFAVEDPSTDELDIAFQLDKGNMRNFYSVRHELDQPIFIVNPASEESPFYITSGDILVVSVAPQAADRQAGCTLELMEEI